MSKTERMLTGFKALRLETLWSQREAAEAVGAAQSHIVKLEAGRANPRLSLIYKILIEFARVLKSSPKELWETFYLEQSCLEYEPIREQAQAALEVDRHFRGSYKAKRFLRDRDVQGPNLSLPDAADMRRLQQLFAGTPLTLTELSKVSGVSRRRLDLLFAVDAEPSANMTLTMFTRLVAALAPAYDASIRETATYVLESDLELLATLP